MEGKSDTWIQGVSDSCNCINWFPAANADRSSVVIETVFQWPGIGSAFNSAVRSQNYNLVMMLALLFVFMTLFASTFVDIMTAMLDPRVKLNG